MSFLLIDKVLQFNNLKNRTAIYAKTQLIVICVKTIIYLLSYNPHDCNFNDGVERDGETTSNNDFLLPVSICAIAADNKYFLEEVHDKITRRKYKLIHKRKMMFYR